MLLAPFTTVSELALLLATSDATLWLSLHLIGDASSVLSCGQGPGGGRTTDTCGYVYNTRVVFMVLYSNRAHLFFLRDICGILPPASVTGSWSLKVGFDFHNLILNYRGQVISAP